MRNPLVTVIIPNYNHAPFLQQRIESVISQSFQDFEIIVLDDCSTDNSREVIESYRRHAKVTQIVYNESNSGTPFKQWIKGLQLAKGSYIWIAESDDWNDLNFLDQTYHKLISDPEIALCYSRSYRTSETGQLEGDHTWAEALDSNRWKQSFINHGNIEIIQYLRFRNTIPNASACLFKKDVLSDFSFLEDFYYCGDWILWVKLIENKKIAYLAEKLNYFRRGGNSTTLKKVPLEKEFRRIKEYFQIINYCRKKSGKTGLYAVKKYEWILDDWLNKFDKYAKERNLLFPPLPLHLLLVMYYRLIRKKIGAKIRIQ